MLLHGTSASSGGGFYNTVDDATIFPSLYGWFLVTCSCFVVILRPFAILSFGTLFSFCFEFFSFCDSHKRFEFFSLQFAVDSVSSTLYLQYTLYVQSVPFFTNSTSHFLLCSCFLCTFTYFILNITGFFFVPLLIRLLDFINSTSKISLMASFSFLSLYSYPVLSRF